MHTIGILGEVCRVQCVLCSVYIVSQREDTTKKDRPTTQNRSVAYRASSQMLHESAVQHLLRCVYRYIQTSLLATFSCTTYVCTSCIYVLFVHFPTVLSLIQTSQYCPNSLAQCCLTTFLPPAWPTTNETSIEGRTTPTLLSSRAKGLGFKSLPPPPSNALEQTYSWPCTNPPPR